MTHVAPTWAYCCSQSSSHSLMITHQSGTCMSLLEFFSKAEAYEASHYFCLFLCLRGDFTWVVKEPKRVFVTELFIFYCTNKKRERKKNNWIMFDLQAYVPETVKPNTTYFMNHMHASGFPRRSIGLESRINATRRTRTKTFRGDFLYSTTSLIRAANIHPDKDSASVSTIVTLQLGG